MGAISDFIKSLADEDASSCYEVIKDPVDFYVKPIEVLRLDYTPVIMARLSWCNERGTGGRSRSAVVHAQSDKSGEILCGAKSKARWGGSRYFVDSDVTCSKCRKVAAGLSQSLRSSFGWL
jgi:hypothetical protein